MGGDLFMSQNDDVSFAVVIPTRNRKDELVRAIASVFKQEHEPTELIIVDDASDEPVSSFVKDPRVTIIRSDENVYGGAARNLGVKAAKASHVAFLDSDDEWLPNHLALMYQKIEKCKADVLWGNFFINDAEEAIIVDSFPEECSKSSIMKWCLNSSGDTCTSALVASRRVMLAVPFDEGLRKHQDLDLALRQSSSAAIGFIRHPSVRVHTTGAGRMSSGVNHAASWFLYRMHREDLDREARIDFLYHLLSISCYFDNGDPMIRVYFVEIIRNLSVGRVGKVLKSTYKLCRHLLAALKNGA